MDAARVEVHVRRERGVVQRALLDVAADARARPMPVENTVSEKNSMMHTTDSDTNAVFTLLAIWRVVNMARPLK